jgi:hypothetical protein
MSNHSATEQATSPQAPASGKDHGAAEDKEVQALLDWWDRDTAVVSDASKILNHPAYQRIIGMGTRAIPLILRELKKGAGFFAWFAALKAITHEDPVPEGVVAGKLCRDAWLNWGRQKGLIE